MKRNDPTELLKSLIRPLLRFPENFEVQAKAVERNLIIEIRPNAGDYGQLNGKQGTTLQCFRTIMTHAGEVSGQEVNLILLQPTVGNRQEWSDPFNPNVNWNPQVMQELIKQTGRALFPGIQWRITESAESSIATFYFKGQVPVRHLPPVSENLGIALKRVFNIIGKALGRNIFVNFSYK